MKVAQPRTAHVPFAHSREAAQECSPGRKPWEKSGNDTALKGRKNSCDPVSTVCRSHLSVRPGSWVEPAEHGQRKSAPEGRRDISPALQRWEKWEARPSPRGTAANSPAFQRWVGVKYKQVPEGRPNLSHGPKSTPSDRAAELSSVLRVSRPRPKERNDAPPSGLAVSAEAWVTRHKWFWEGPALAGPLRSLWTLGFSP